jgi:hypothetical protein
MIHEHHEIVLINDLNIVLKFFLKLDKRTMYIRASWDLNIPTGRSSIFTKKKQCSPSLVRLLSRRTDMISGTRWLTLANCFWNLLEHHTLSASSSTINIAEPTIILLELLAKKMKPDSIINTSSRLEISLVAIVSASVN